MAVAEASPLTSRGGGVVAFAGLDADRTVVWLRGEHDLSTVTAVAETLARAIAVDDADFVVDMSEVEFIDASTVRLIVRTREFLHSRSRSLVLRSPSPCALAMLDRCGLAHLVDPSPATVRPMARSDGALVVGLAGLPAERRNRRAERPTPIPRGVGIPVRIVPSAAASRMASLLLTDPVDDGARAVDSRGP